MYESFYGLHRPPFAVTPDPSLLYMSRAHREALAAIVYGIETRKGFIVCTGEVGTGKTTVVRAFFDGNRVYHGISTGWLSLSNFAAFLV